MPFQAQLFIRGRTREGCPGKKNVMNVTNVANVMNVLIRKRGALAKAFPH